MNILIFGKSGQVATSLVHQASAHGIVATSLGRDDFDLASLQDHRDILELIDAHQPKAIINAAAYTAVDKAESEPELADALNHKAPQNLALACKERGLPFLHISTDFVFDGLADRPYRESDPTGPVSIYGSSKLAGEKAAIAAGGCVAIMRTAWVFSATGGNFVKTMLRLGAERETLTVVADQFGGPTPADAIADALYIMAKQLIDAPEKDGIFHFAGAPQTHWADFARAIMEEAGLAANVTNITTADYPTPAARPAWSVLDCTKIEKTFGIKQPNWRDTLRETIQTLRQH